MQFSTTLALFGLVALGSSHIVINTPVPFKESVTNNFNGPLDQQGSDFPCKAKGVYTPQGASTEMPLGSSQDLKFTGSAVHGGGSCQISVTYDTAPTKNSVWKVIHSIHGGCPISGAGNLEGNADLVTPNSYKFTIPTELPAGEAVLAWTWFNRIGNREMYMNCAPITITAGSARRDEGSLSARNATQLVERDLAAYNSLPIMYVANTSGDCITDENVNIEFPHPGSSVEKNAAAVGSFTAAPACGDKNGSAAGPSNTAAPVVSVPATSAAGPAPTTSSSGSVPGGVFFPVPNPTVVAPSVSVSATASAVSSVPAISAPVQNPSPTQTASPTQTTTLTVVPTKPTSVSAAPPAGTGAVGALSGPCSSEGSWNCISGTSFQRCASGSWSVAMLMASGTLCTPGESAAFEVKAIKAKRNIRFSGAHIRRHAHRS